MLVYEVMIRQIRGTVLGHEAGGVVVDVSGWGVLVTVTSPESYNEGSSLSLKTYMAVNQDGVELYGFPTEDERHFFELLMCVPGIGPKTALSILRRAPRETLETAIAKRDLDYLVRVVGLGKKSAEKLMVELSEKVQAAGASHDAHDAEVFDTLVALGYTEREARAALTAIPSGITGKDARLKAALGAHAR